MKEAYGVFGDISYEYAIGRIQATSHTVLSAEQWTRLQDGEEQEALKLLEEYGYPAAEGRSPQEVIQEELCRVVSFVREISPDPMLTDLLFFEEDALNLKLYLKARLSGKDPANLVSPLGSWPPDVMEICTQAEDLSLLGEDIEQALQGIFEETDPGHISDRVDAAFYAHALREAEKRRCRPLVEWLRLYGAARNRITRVRMEGLHRDPQRYSAAFLPLDKEEDRILSSHSPNDLSQEEFLAQEEEEMQKAIKDLKYDNGIGVIAEYYLTKKKEAASLRLLFVRKKLMKTAFNQNTF